MEKSLPGNCDLHNLNTGPLPVTCVSKVPGANSLPVFSRITPALILNHRFAHPTLTESESEVRVKQCTLKFPNFKLELEKFRGRETIVAFKLGLCIFNTCSQERQFVLFKTNKYHFSSPTLPCVSIWLRSFADHSVR